ncbi:MAG: ketoacyl-ACP synthase III [candidate division KSB1 bacterium]|nr:ketoacyl-ACP synthase III [candidate division KSB1 bacterium]MDZ7334075.1 ketoacyl-ACP synthase III [candidate division KSB1 bacterium]MDZ7357084.1 ketoacyl-ACP synthase III [candidate division KSB1 bacterium]MDZ7399563.1 ketoacyl-ACP synthase III [candidate division KSB1 bacterium]
MYKARITGTGMYVPEKVVTNFDLEKLMDTSDAWIRERAGIIERRFAEPEVGPAGLAVEAAKQALQNAHLEPKDVEFIIFATLSPEYQFPGSGVLLQEKLGLPGVPALDIRNQCTGFIYGLAVADQFIRTGMYRRIMLVGSEIHSTGLDLSTRGRDVAVLFGDGAGVVIVERSDDPNRCILSSHLHADGRFAKELYVENPGSLHVPRLTKEMLDGTSIYPFMNGRQVFKHAVVRFCEAIEECLSANQIAPEQVKLVIPHQANQRITEAVAARFGYSMDRVFSNIHKYGNTTAASIPIALHEALMEGRIQPGDYVVLVAFGSGFTWGSILMRW